VFERAVLQVSINSPLWHRDAMRIADSRKGISGLLLVAAVSILAVVVRAVAVAVPLWGSPGTTTSTQTTTDKSLGISLTLTVTPQSGPTGGTFQINASVLNTLPRVNNVTGVNDYRGVSGNPVCNFAPIAFEVLRGSYTASNFASGTVVNIHGVQNYMCVIGASDLKSYAFQAKSDVFTGTASGGAPITRAAHVSVDVSQQWSKDLTSRGPLAPGVYTVVAADNWGQLAVVHFTVS
jgi:hypothetical protein